MLLIISIFLYTCRAKSVKLQITTQAGLTTSGTAQTELIIGSAQGDVVNGNGGNDLLLGGEGDDTINAGAGNDVIYGGNGNDTLNGYGGDDILNGGTGNDILNGGTGNDTYLYAAGSGQDTITDYDTTTGNIDTVKLVGLNPSQITFTREIGSDGYLTNDLVLKVIGTTDSLRIKNYYADAAYKIEKLVFEDGTVWGTAELNAAVILPTGTTLHTTSGNDLVDLRNAAGTTVSGVYYYGTGYGNDTYLYAAGSGQDTITDYDTTTGNIDTVKLVGLNPSQITFTREIGSDGYLTNDLVLKVIGTTDSLRIKNYYADAAYKIEKLVFEDGTVWGTAELNAAVILPTGTTLHTTSGNDLVDLRNAAGTTVSGVYYYGTGYGNDTYLYAAGSGQDTITDYDTTTGNIDTVKLVGLNPSQITFTREIGSDGYLTNDLVLKVIGTTDSLRIKNYYADAAYKIEKLVFEDGTVWGTAELNAAVILPTGTTLHTTSGNDLVDLRNAAGTTVSGVYYYGTGYGNDTYLYAAGSGQDTITDYDTTTGNIDTVKLVGLNPSQITFTREIGSDGYLTNDLVLKVIGTTDSLRIKNYYADAAYKIEKLVFEDGTVWGTAELNAAVILPTGTTLHTTSGNDLVDLRNAAGTTVSGVYYYGTGYGNDTYLYAAGSGQDTITDYDTTTGNIDTVKLVGLNPSQITFTREIGSDGYLTNDLVLKVIGTTDSLRIKNYYADAAYKIEKLVFEDGTVWGTAELNAAVILPTGTTLHTTSGNDLVDLRNAASTTVSGVYYYGTGYGNDTYLYAAGSGQDTITDYDTTTGNIDTVKLVGLNPSQITFTREIGSDGYLTNDLVLKVIGTTDSLRIKNYYADAAYKIEKLVFEDGTVWGTAELNAAVILPTGTTLHTTSGNDLVDLRNAAGTTVSGVYYYGTGYGNDTYLYAAGSGQDTITDYDTTTGNIDTVKLVGLNPSQITFTREIGSDGYLTNDLVLKVIGTTDSLRIKNYYADAAYKIEKLVFEDGTVWGTAELNAAVILPTGTTLHTTSGNDLVDLRNAASTTVSGVYYYGTGYGNDTYLYAAGSGQDTITDYDTTTGNIDTVKLVGLNPSQITFTREIGSDGYLTNDLVLKVIGTTDSLRIKNYYADAAYKIEKIQFDDGNTLGNVAFGFAGNDILKGTDGNDALNDTGGRNLLIGGAGSDTLTGNSGNEMFVGGTGNDTITTGSGADIIAFNRGDGRDVVNGGPTSTSSGHASTGSAGQAADNTIILGKGISYADIALSKVNNDLIVEVGTTLTSSGQVSEQITFANWYDTTANYKSVLNLQVMADAMAGFDATSTDPLLNQAVQNFDFTAIVASFDQARGTSATFMHWCVTNSLLAAHISGSNSVALGGDLAHQYGTNGGFTGMNLAAAQDVLNAPQFGAQAQTLRPLQGLQGGGATL